MPSPRILFVSVDRDLAATVLVGRAARLFQLCAPGNAAEELAAPGKSWEGVVWDLTRGRPRGERPAAAMRLRVDLPFLALVSPSRRSGSLSGPRPPDFRMTLRPPVDAGLLLDTIRRESRMMVLERGLTEARALGRAQKRRLAVLSDISSAANSVLEPRKVMEIVMSRAQDLIQAEAWSLLLVDQKEHTLSSHLMMGEQVRKVKNYRLKIGQGVAGWVVQHKRAAIVNNVKRDRRFDPSLDILTGLRTRSILCAPLISRGRIIGVAELINKRRGPFSSEDLRMMMTLVEPGAVAIENAILYQRSEELTVTDDLTKLYNSRYLNIQLGREIKRARRYGTQASLIFLDLDGFKNVNDTYGHLAGSRALYEVGRVICQTVREVDVVSRYGGDEFTVILPQTGAPGAMTIADRIRTRLEATMFLHSVGVEARLTASFGVATFPEHGQNKEDLIQKADQAMYCAKDRGKNLVVLAVHDARAAKGTR